MPNQARTPQDNCPKWADALIERLCELEVQLGNVNPEATTEGWQIAKVQELYARVEGDHDADEGFAEGVIESLFQQISEGLTDEGHGPAAIASFINARIPSGRLPYCNAAEVQASLRDR